MFGRCTFVGVREKVNLSKAASYKSPPCCIMNDSIAWCSTVGCDGYLKNVGGVLTCELECEVDSPDAKSGEVDDWLDLLEHGEKKLGYCTPGPLQFGEEIRKPIIPPAHSKGPVAGNHTLPLRSQEGSALSWAFRGDMERDVECAIRETWGLARNRLVDRSTF